MKRLLVLVLILGCSEQAREEEGRRLAPVVIEKELVVSVKTRPPPFVETDPYRPYLPPPPVWQTGTDGDRIQLTLSKSEKWARQEESALRTVLTFERFAVSGKTWLPHIATIPIVEDKWAVVLSDPKCDDDFKICGWLMAVGWGWHMDPRSGELSQFAGGIGSRRGCRFHGKSSLQQNWVSGWNEPSIQEYAAAQQQISFESASTSE